MVELIIELLVNIFQSFAVTHFLIKCLGIRNDADKPTVEYAVGITVTLVYLEVLSRITLFESVGIFVYLSISLTFSALLLKGSATEKIFCNLLMLANLAFSAMLGGGLAGLIYKVDYINIVMSGTYQRYVGVFLTQIILSILFVIIHKLMKMLKNTDSRYVMLLSGIPVLSIIICCLILYKDSQDYTTYVICTISAIVGVFVVNIISLILLVIEHKTYTQKIHEEVLINAYQQKEKDVDTIRTMKLETDKASHEMKRILTIALEFLKDKEYEKASEFLGKFADAKAFSSDNYVYCDNMILNYLLNRKITQCNARHINVECFVHGVIDGIEDVDMYILVENLIDNAMEACIQSKKRKIDFVMYGDEEYIGINIGNTTKGNVLKNNPHMNTTKSDKHIHGYGIQNIRDVVERYNGKIKYQANSENYIFCNVKLSKINRSR